ncbi:T9SS type A sorting domain-containing protein [Adhaeribacter soli]|uniref:T9SS type A sorting domain-containing protein n=1 Tax=Adhaeribacter soli TaxID=2607655 RepID=A0A5N1J6K8_9BACT|nr:T9SS type A sorting domain-containing protein [Adhaeribacter soli]KAA9345592.1 T9SS type A sorting domain-containing protein [Adhaeribacter soli]
MKKIALLLVCLELFAFRVFAQFSTVTPLDPVAVTSDTKDKPQSKVWMHDGRFWTVLITGSGTFLYRLDGAAWKSMLKISAFTYGRADCKMNGNVNHILLYRGAASQLISVEYEPVSFTYKLWSKRTAPANITLDTGVETATIDLDTKGRMWLASDGTTNVNVRWSDAPYTTWSAPVNLATVMDDDICAVIALPVAGKIGVMWSDQGTKRFGFKTHTDGAVPGTWSADEVPASQSALNVGFGMADDHINMKAAADGTLYCAVKTGYNHTSYPRIALLVRRPTGAWDNLYEVERQLGTRPIVLLNEDQNKIKVVYTASETGGNILYRESAISPIAFGNQFTLINGTYNFATSCKQTYTASTVILASTSTWAVGVTGTDQKPVTPNLKLELDANPNPFSSLATINYQLPEAGQYSVSLYDHRGKKTTVLKQGNNLAGEKGKVTIDGSGMKRGMYLVRLQTNKEARSLKLLHQK